MDVETVITGPLPLRDLSYVILDATQCAAAYQKIVELGIEIGKTPRDLLFSQGTQPRQLYHFNPDRLFECFDEVVIDPRFMLDYLYLRDTHGGRSLFYTRKRFVSPFIKSAAIYQQLFYGKRRPYLHHINFSFSPRGVFQFLLFVDTVDRLYADSGTVAGHVQLVFFNPQRDQLLQQCEHEWADEHKLALMQLDLRPRIQMTAKYAVIQVYGFSTQNGVAEIEYRVDMTGQGVQRLSCEQVIDLQTINQSRCQPVSATGSEEANEPPYSTSAAVLQ